MRIGVYGLTDDVVFLSNRHCQTAVFSPPRLAAQSPELSSLQPVSSLVYPVVFSPPYRLKLSQLHQLKLFFFSPIRRDYVDSLCIAALAGISRQFYSLSRASLRVCVRDG